MLIFECSNLKITKNYKFTLELVWSFSESLISELSCFSSNLKLLVFLKIFYINL